MTHKNYIIGSFPLSVSLSLRTGRGLSQSPPAAPMNLTQEATMLNEPIFDNEFLRWIEGRAEDYFWPFYVLVWLLLAIHVGGMLWAT